MEIIAKTMEGLEEVLANEIEELGGTHIEKLRRAVRYRGELDLVYRSNIWLRTALRVLVPIDEFQVMDENALYDRVKELPWEDLFGLKQTFAIDAVTSGEFFRHSKYAALKTKDAIVDRFYAQFGSRPNVNVHNPDFRINLHIRKRTVSLSLDSSGESLHKRGYRVYTVPAPLNEVLAAGLIYLSGWDGSSPLYDPMCGSGTLAIEAARLAYGMPPQSTGRQYAYQRWMNYEADLHEEALSYAVQPLGSPQLFARDKNLRNMKTAQLNAQEAGVADLIAFDKGDFFRKDPPTLPLTLITNPPYDERLKEEDIFDFYKQIGDTFKQKYPGTTAWVISGHVDAIKRLGLKPSRKFTVFNGPILSKFHKYELYAGSKKA